MRVLLVEDDGSAAQFISKGLREASYAVDVARDGARASALCSDNEYDAIVLDVMLPKKDGLAGRCRCRSAISRSTYRRGAPGAGLRLSIAAWIAQVHGGTVALEGSSAQGSVFVARFPHLKRT